MDIYWYFYRDNFQIGGAEVKGLSSVVQLFVSYDCFFRWM